MVGMRFLVAEGGGYALPAALAEALVRRGERRTRALRNAGVRPTAARGNRQGTARPGR